MSVVFYATDVTTIRKIQDRLANMLAVSQGPWSVQAKFYRSNPASFKDTPAQMIYTVTSSNEPNQVNLFTKEEALVTDEVMLPILASKLQSLWTTRQTFRVEGEAFKWHDMDIKIGNVFLQGNFKGLVAELYVACGNEQEAREKIQNAIEKLQIAATVGEIALKELDLKKQYIKLNG